jgi:hypothetical protein
MKVTIVLRGGALDPVQMESEEIDRLLHDLDNGTTDPQRYAVKGADAFLWLRLGEVAGVRVEGKSVARPAAVR